jgi:hypothetical protein
VNDQQRPGGLTALAVLNFVFSVPALLSTLTPLFPLLAQLAPETSDADRAPLDALTTLGTEWLAFVVANGAIGGVLLIVSGIGYLQQKRVLGRMLGNVYAVFAIAMAIPMAVWLPVTLGGGLSLGTLVNFIYPVLTLVLLNLTFKDDLTR